MAIGSTPTKGARRTGEKNKPQPECPSSDSSKTNSGFRRGSNQGDSDSEATSFSSSVQGSTSSSTSTTDRCMEGGNHQKKPIDKLNSKKLAASGSIRPSRRRPKSQLMSLPDDGSSITCHPFPVEPSDSSPDLQKPVQKFTRSSSLRSLRILRKKNILSSESKPSTVKDLHSKKATFSSTLKDSKFPQQVEPKVGVKESEEVLSATKLCPYEHCSVRAHHHHEPPLKRFTYLKRRSSKDQKSINPENLATDQRSVKKKEAKVTQKVSNECGKKKSFDFSIEFYAKTRPEPSFEPSCSRDDAYLPDIMFGVSGDDANEAQNLQMYDHGRAIVNVNGENDGLDRFADVEERKPGFKNGNQMSMWRLIHRCMVSGLIDQLQEEKQSCSDDNDAVNQGKEIQKMLAVKMVREAIEKLLPPEEDGLEKNTGDDLKEPNQAKPEAGIVSLRSRTSGETKNSNEWMLDYALQQVVAELAPTQKRKVALLVKSFEMVTPKLTARSCDINP